MGKEVVKYNEAGNYSQLMENKQVIICCICGISNQELKKGKKFQKPFFNKDSFI